MDTWERTFVLKIITYFPESLKLSGNLTTCFPGSKQGVHLAHASQSIDCKWKASKQTVTRFEPKFNKEINTKFSVVFMALIVKSTNLAEIIYIFLVEKKLKTIKRKKIGFQFELISFRSFG